MMSWLKRSESKRSNISFTFDGKAPLISGMFYKTDKGYFYIKGNKRYRVFSEKCFKSWSVEAINTSIDSLSHIPYAGILGFRDGTIIHNLADGKIYIVADNKKIHLTDPGVFPDGWIEHKKILVSQEETNLHKEN